MRVEDQAAQAARNCSSCGRIQRNLSAVDRGRNYQKKNSDKYFLDL